MDGNVTYFTNKFTYPVSGLIAGGSIIGLIGIILQVTGVVTPGSPTGFLGSNGSAFLLLAILVVAIIAPLLSVKKVKHND